MSEKKIRIMKNGPYIVTGGVPLSEKVITPVGNHYVYEDGRTLHQAETYALCRCGKSSNPPFCDGTHIRDGFDCQETASMAPYTERSETLRGPGLDMLDDGRCAFARFCHRERGDAWELLNLTDHEDDRREAITAMNECPAGRLTAVTKDGKLLEPEFEPAVEILQDPEEGVGCGIFVKGRIPIESADGAPYEPRSRVVLCRCGQSKNKPFCDMAHVHIGFRDRD
jgi:CDGSH-type Zn-finger protein